MTSDEFTTLVSVVHLTDLHLFVSSDGSTRPPSELTALTRLLRSGLGRFGVTEPWADGLGVHNSYAVDALSDALDALSDRARSEPHPTVVALTGDVEAMGRRLPVLARADRGMPFPGYEFLRSVLDQSGIRWRALVHGNHDVWSSGWPLLTPNADFAGNAEDLAEVLEWSHGACVAIEVGQTRVEFYQLSSIPTTSLTLAAAATGRPSCYPPPDDSIESAIAGLESAVGGAPDGDAIRILLVHHPLHDFPPGGLGHRWTTGRHIGADKVAEAIERLGFQIVLTGHRHRTDPAPDFDASNGQRVEQSPLLPSVFQLCASSPTQSPGSNGIDEHSYSFSKYEVLASEQSTNSLVLRRLMFIYSDVDRVFLPADGGYKILSTDLAF